MFCGDTGWGSVCMYVSKLWPLVACAAKCAVVSSWGGFKWVPQGGVAGWATMECVRGRCCAVGYRWGVEGLAWLASKVELPWKVCGHERNLSLLGGREW